MPSKARASDAASAASATRAVTRAGNRSLSAAAAFSPFSRSRPASTISASPYWSSNSLSVVPVVP